MWTPELHWVSGIEPARLALSPRPRGGEWLADEVESWKREAVDTVVSLLERQEAFELELRDEASLCAQHAIEFLHHPIVDRGLPASQAAFASLVDAVHARLVEGRAVVIHCRAGIGRTGLLAGCVLHVMGVPGGDVFHLLSRSRGIAMPDTAAQAAWVEAFARRRRAGDVSGAGT